ncbi:DUF1579 domain-containing protein [Pseudarthrobacter phenanthrenivorans]|jgi:hypothetical protein|uniref:DUF1579 domain-containing protein n=1 Tax=Pseudarthrobacter phenanthrenivorans (strain DSM 18606 / JCM 16027 / LMG 23796 / Sphe3) TaxID=930171 RepID=F0M800_PSEPM|nr:hypothetical protein Asphe3_14220 [Pseudarthrobacter phenanthrenivorans Sphe3]TPV51353.1 DUF1579 domain-containing protein [Pseudarthrobacter phenanthrenivorans]
MPARGPGALAGFLGHWRGTTRFAAGPWGQEERSVESEVTYRAVAAGTAVVQSYRHLEPDGTHFEGYGIFTVDPAHQDVLWYYVDNASPGQAAPVRCTWHDGVLRVERRSSAGWTRHTLRVDGDVLTHVTEVRNRGRKAGGESGEADGAGSAYVPFMTSRFQRS